MSGFVLPGYVVLTLNSDTQVISSSPAIQSLFPSQARSIGINFTDRLQKKYLLSMSFLTERRVQRVGQDTNEKCHLAECSNKQKTT